MFKKIVNYIKFSIYYFQDDKNFILRLFEDKAKETLKNCNAFEISSTEELEDLLFHIKTYYAIPEAIKETKYPNVEIFDLKKLLEGEITDLKKAEEFLNYVEDVETQRAIERDFIFEHAKILSFGSDL